MNRAFDFSPKFIAAAALATAAFCAATAAEARPEVHLSIGIQSGPVWVAPVQGHVRPYPRPVYAHPGLPYVHRAPVVVRAPVFVVPPPSFVRPGWRGHDGRFASQRDHAWHRADQRRHRWHEEAGGGDRQGRDDRGPYRSHRD